MRYSFDKMTNKKEIFTKLITLATNSPFELGLKQFVKNGYNINTIDEKGNTPIINIIVHFDRQYLNDYNYQSDLVLFCVEKMIEFSVVPPNFNITDQDQMTPLAWAFFLFKIFDSFFQQLYELIKKVSIKIKIKEFFNIKK